MLRKENSRNLAENVSIEFNFGDTNSFDYYHKSEPKRIVTALGEKKKEIQPWCFRMAFW